jgi:hypothetical protein
MTGGLLADVTSNKVDIFSLRNARVLVYLRSEQHGLLEQ